MLTIRLVESYVALPDNKQTEVAILLLTDILGHKFNNLQLIADQFAKNGYFVVMPDLFVSPSMLAKFVTY